MAEPTGGPLGPGPGAAGGPGAGPGPGAAGGRGAGPGPGAADGRGAGPGAAGGRGAGPEHPGGSGLRAAVAEVWCAALGTGEARDEDHFFMAGGDSVLAVETAMALREATGTEPVLDILFEYPEFGRLVAALGGERRGSGHGAPRALTPAEERLWAVEQVHRGTPLYHVGAVYRFDGPVDVPRLRAALDALAAEHDALRRGFQAPGRAVTAAVVSVPCRWVDARDVPAEAVGRLLDDEVRVPFDLARPPLLRALAVGRGQAGDVLLLTVHHLVCDGRSLALLETRLGELYDGAGPVAAEPVAAAGTLSPPPRREEAALEHWRRVLAGAPAGLDLPHDLPRPARLGTAGGVHTLTMPARAVAALEAVAEQERLSPFMAWTAAYVTALSAVTGERDLVVAVPASSRGPRQRAEVGMFVGILPLRVGLRPGATARNAAGQVRRTVTEALAHRQVPFQTMVEESRHTADPSRAPLAQAAFTFLDASEGGLRLRGTAAARELLPTGTAKYELMWSVTRCADATTAEPAYRAELEYHAELFSPEAAEDLHRRLVAAVGTAFARPDEPLPVTGPMAQAPYTPVHERVRRHAVRRPGAPAVLHGATRLTYRELDLRATAIAAGLRGAGLGRGSVVAVSAPRGADTVAAFLGVLYAGCAYLPVDVRQPVARSRALVRSAAHAVLVPGPAEAAAYADTVPVLRLDTLPAPCDPAGPPLPPVALTPEDAAYVMFTSGSTGEPKGVVVPHRAISRLVPDADFATVGTGDRVAHLSSPAFDASTFEIWGALAGGATLVVDDRETATSPAGLRRFLERERITVLWLTTTLLNQVVDFAPDALRHLRVLLAGGEQLDGRRLAKLLAGSPPGRVVNGYGPTENTTFSTTHDISAADTAEGPVPIGTPISGTTAYALGPGGSPVRAGEAGELYVGGDGLARGYLDAPALTADAFVPDPFDPRGGRRMYRTGDRVRVLPGGGFAFLGRRDDQVKVRGHRVELAEVERAVRDLEGVADAVVVARPADTGTEITACVTGPAPGDAGALAARLREVLPHYMVPEVAVLDRIPVNANGKADRTALLAALGPAAAGMTAPAGGPLPPSPSPGAVRPPAEAEPGGGEDPHDALARGVHTLWCEALGTARAHPEDNFLALGGHSIKALRLLARVDEEYGADIELVHFLTSPTLRELTALVRGQAAGTEAPGGTDGTDTPGGTDGTGGTDAHDGADGADGADMPDGEERADESTG
ncbi:non-ribosomal peptide synthetase [Streptomyces pacificus]|uniref:Amino acid adenylation domain-containing protein n=1 Tax=Streptomyces pacificus TaxID=2705029 RepID=A0A6A0AYL4_9ACTN|nr:non-ribosomal peptide synthetase [Streptomyces pacificus]GFH37942.1 amino acid adenylation domain-containing protein [Streptomyces pacificus]